MKRVNILDCTLRDGAYLVNKEFGKSSINGIIDGLMRTGIDFVEIGFLQNEGAGEGKQFITNAKMAEQYIPKNKGTCKFTVLADFSRYDISKLDDNSGQSFDAVRACFFKNEREDVLDFCRKIQEKGYFFLSNQ